MEQLLKQHFGNVDIYRFNGHKDSIAELGISVNYIIINNDIYFVSEDASTDVRVEIMYAKEPQ